jgi:protein PhnA
MRRDLRNAADAESYETHESGPFYFRLSLLPLMKYLSSTMELKSAPDLLAFFSTYLMESDIGSEAETVSAFVTATSSSRRNAVLDQARRLLEASQLPVEDFGSEANRWFADQDEARVWLKELVDLLANAIAASGESAEGDAVTKDSNGTPLEEGDSVTVIKDLKVKGGSSDLKRGTLIKKIHLIGDPENIECRVDGSTLVLKTMFLKKA